MATDNFTDSDETTLPTHDSKWVDVDSTYDAASVWTKSNLAESIAAWNDGGALYNDGQPDDQMSQVKCVGNASISDPGTIRLLARATKDSTRGYVVYFDTVSGGNFTSLTLLKDTTWKAAQSGLSYSVSSDHTFKISATGQSTTTVKVFVDSNEHISFADSSSPILSGLPGFYLLGRAAILHSRIDDWTDGIAAGGNPWYYYANL